MGLLKSLERASTYSGGGAASWTPRNVGGAPGLPSPTRPHGHSRSNAVCRGQHPLGVDERAPAEVYPVLTIYSQAHLPGPLSGRGLLPSHDVHSLQGLAWSWGRKHPQDRTQPGPCAHTTLGFCEPTRPSWGFWSAGEGAGPGPARVRTHQGPCGPGSAEEATPAPADSASGRREKGSYDPAGGWARPGSIGCGVLTESGTPRSGISPGLGSEVLFLQI